MIDTRSQLYYNSSLPQSFANGTLYDLAWSCPSVRLQKRLFQHGDISGNRPLRSEYISTREFVFSFEVCTLKASLYDISDVCSRTHVNLQLPSVRFEVDGVSDLVLLINPFKPNWISHSYHLDQSISIFICI